MIRAMQHYTKFALAVAAILLVGLSSWGQGSETESALHLVINEIEINPAGLDTDSEWVELLNPTDGPIDLLGWQISYSYRSEGFLLLSETSHVIPPGGRYVFVYPGLRLRNAEAHAFRLMDPEGNVVEETAPFKDESDDDATWQRFPDGGDPLFIDLWLFQAGSRNKSNS
ncbi:lamin tail domain-containing protein [Candidatus Bipolaricaulota bacterium]|nr:lamin tail domain-containing protein [Candidatus Bipolaricaulota bacterium]